MLLMHSLLVLKGQMLSLYHIFLDLLEIEPSSAFFQDSHFALDCSWVGYCTHPLQTEKAANFATVADGGVCAGCEKNIAIASSTLTILWAKHRAHGKLCHHVKIEGRP